MKLLDSGESICRVAFSARILLHRNLLKPSGTDTGQKQGFALVIALSLMALLLLLMLSMSILLRVESNASSMGLAQLRAREAARLALMMALGDLQKHAGPDQRVTARAEITGVTNNNRFWTGVWDTTAPTSEPVWLVSGMEPDPANQADQTMQLVGAGSVGLNPSQYVVVPSIPIEGTDGRHETEIAWWISDEGVKTSVGAFPLSLRERPNFLEESSMDARDLQLANTHGLEAIFSEYDRFNDTDETQILRRIQSIDQLLEIGKFSASSDFSGEAPFHALTPGSLGVLASTINNPDAGLMRDLSLFPQLLGSGVEEYLLMGEENAETQANAGQGTEGKRLFKDILGLEDLGGLTDGEVYLPIAPILSNFMMAFTIRQNAKADTKLYLRMVFFCELWNPYTHGLNIRKADGTPLDLQLEITGLPDIDVEKTVYKLEEDEDGNVVSKNEVSRTSTAVELQTIVGDPENPDNALTIRLKNVTAEDWLPGRTKNWTGITGTSPTTGPSPYESTETISKNWNLNDRKLGNSTGIDTGADIALHTESDSSHDALLRHFSADKSELEIKLYAYDPGAGSKELIASYGTITYEPVSTLPASGIGFDYKHKGITFGYHITLREPHTSNDDPDFYRGRWLYEDDPRNLQPLFSTDWQFDNDHASDMGSPYIPVIDAISPLLIPTPQSINQDSNTINFPDNRRLIDRSSPNLNKLWQDVPIFELPRERVLSLASLQHIYIHNERPFQVGNSWADEGANNELEWFDRYYFSGLSRDDNPTDYDTSAGLPNPLLVNYHFDDPPANITDWQAEPADNEAASREPAEKFMVSNRFNLNSTSIAAWKSVLGSLRLNDFQYLDYPEEDTSDLSSLAVGNASREGTFARFSHSLEETYEAPATPAFEGYGSNLEPVAPSAFYRHGARRLDSGQLEDLAREIVSLLKTKAQPFTSVKEFLSVNDNGLSPAGDKSLLEEAIANVLGTGNGGRQQWYHEWETNGTPRDESGESPIEIDHFSPGFLTQADVMTAIGPMLSPRSDTFKIRARGICYGRQATVESAATIEATVQRIPTPTNPDADPAGPTSRQFKVLTFRWMKDEEI